MAGCLPQFPGHIVFNEKTSTYEVYYPASPNPQAHNIGTPDDVCNAVAGRTGIPFLDGNGDPNPLYREIIKNCQRSAEREGGRPLTVKDDGTITIFTHPSFGVTVILDFNDHQEPIVLDEQGNRWGWGEYLALGLGGAAVCVGGKIFLGLSQSDAEWEKRNLQAADALRRKQRNTWRRTAAPAQQEGAGHQQPNEAAEEERFAQRLLVEEVEEEVRQAGFGDPSPQRPTPPPPRPQGAPQEERQRKPPGVAGHLGEIGNIVEKIITIVNDPRNHVVLGGPQTDESGVLVEH